jgi:hypothetical protein
MQPLQPKGNPLKLDGITILYVSGMIKYFFEKKKEDLHLPPKDGVYDPELLAIPHGFRWREGKYDHVSNKRLLTFDVCGIKTIKPENDFSRLGNLVDTCKFLLKPDVAHEAAEPAADEAAELTAHEAAEPAADKFVKEILRHAFAAARKHDPSKNQILAIFDTLYAVFGGTMNPVGLFLKIINIMPQDMIGDTAKVKSIKVLMDLYEVSLAFPEKSREYLGNLRRKRKSFLDVEEIRLKAVINKSVESKEESIKIPNEALKTLYGDLWARINLNA